MAPRSAANASDAATRRAVKHAARRMSHLVVLSLLAADGPEPLRGAAYLLDARDVLRELRGALALR